MTELKNLAEKFEWATTCEKCELKNKRALSMIEHLVRKMDYHAMQSELWKTECARLIDRKNAPWYKRIFWSDNEKKNKSQKKTGKWARDPWIRILELLAQMSKEERERCIRATAAFYNGR